MHIKKLSATLCFSVLGSFFGSTSMALEEVIVNGSAPSNEPFISARLGGGGTGGGLGGNGAGFGGNNIDQIAEQERQRLEEEKKKRDESEKEQCVRRANQGLRNCIRNIRNIYELRLSGCSNSTNSANISLGPLGSFGYESANQDFKCLNQTKAARDTGLANCEVSHNTDGC